VQSYHLGLDFRGTAMGARLAEGDYIVVQLSSDQQRAWDWEDWVYEPRAGLILSRSSPKSLIQNNYVVFGVSRYDGD
jgi:hypothetical protein